MIFEKDGPGASFVEKYIGKRQNIFSSMKVNIVLLSISSLDRWWNIKISIRWESLEPLTLLSATAVQARHWVQDYQGCLLPQPEWWNVATDEENPKSEVKLRLKVEETLSYLTHSLSSIFLPYRSFSDHDQLPQIGKPKDNKILSSHGEILSSHGFYHSRWTFLKRWPDMFFSSKCFSFSFLWASSF